MAAVEGMLASAVVKLTIQQIASAMGGEIKLLQSFTGDLEKMRMTLETLGAVLSDAERRSIRDRSARLWLKRLENAASDISDMLDEFHVRIQKMAFPLNFSARISMSHNMKKMGTELEEIKKQHEITFQFTQGSISNQQDDPSIWRTAGKVQEADIIGRTEDKENILSCLKKMLSTLPSDVRKVVLPIYGMGGIGKTTLAQLVYNNDDELYQGYLKVWVYVSQEFDMNKIGSSIISQLSEEQSQIKITDLELINRSLEKLIAGKKILLVLDDMWEKDESNFDTLMDMLNVGMDSLVVVLVTTRSQEFAQKIYTIEPYKLEPLTEDKCWTIIKQKSAFEKRDDKEEIEQIGRMIAKKCGGVALAAQSLGYVLHRKMINIWELVLNDMWMEPISTDPSWPERNVYSSLQLSYTYMQPKLRLCFAYCVIYPKGHNIDKDKLIHQWDSLGFLGPSDMSISIGEDFITKLLSMSFLQYSKATPSAAGIHGENNVLLTMHDLVHDLCRSVMGDEFLDTSKEGDHAERSSCRYILVTDSSKALLVSSATSHAKFRSLQFHGCTKIEIHGATLSCAKYLQVLDFSECVINKLPPCIGKLKGLRYLNAPGVEDGIIPKSITKLSKLCYLNLRGSYRISALPESVGDMDGLKYLDLCGCSRLERLPKSFQKLNKLVHLDLSYCEYIEDLWRPLLSLTKLEHLNLSECYGLLEPQGVFGNLTKLRYLNLSGTMSSTGLTREKIQGSIECINKLSNLEHLDLSRTYELERIPESFGNHRKLHTLDLSDCRNLVSIPESIVNNLKVIIM